MAGAALEPIVAAFQREELTVIEVHRRIKELLTMTGIARTRESVRVVVLVARNALLIEIQECFLSSHERETFQGKALPDSILVAVIALQKVVLTREIELDMRMPVGFGYLRSPGDLVHKLELGSEVLRVTTSAVGFTALMDGVVIPDSFAQLCGYFVMAIEAALRESLVAMASATATRSREIPDLRMSRGELPRHWRIRCQQPHHHDDEGRPDNQWSLRIEQHA